MTTLPIRTRRVFQLGLAALMLSLGAVDCSKVLAQGRYDNMELLKKHLPPGFLHCRDRAIRIIYAQEVAGLWSDFGRVSYRMASRFDGYYDSVIVKSVSRRIEPAWYELREEMDFRTGRGTTFSDPQDDVPQIRSFDEGINYHFIAYVTKKGNEGTKRAAENHLVHSIAYAAYDDKDTAERKAKQYLGANLGGKEAVILEMRSIFENMAEGDRASTDPRDPFNRKLVAAWSAFWLAQSYWREQNNRDGDRDDLILAHLEQPLAAMHPSFQVRDRSYFRRVRGKSRLRYEEHQRGVVSERERRRWVKVAEFPNSHTGNFRQSGRNDVRIEFRSIWWWKMKLVFTFARNGLSDRHLVINGVDLGKMHYALVGEGKKKEILDDFESGNFETIRHRNTGGPKVFDDNRSYDCKDGICSIYVRADKLTEIGWRF